MKIIIAGSFRHWNALERHYINYLKPIAAEVDLYPWPDLISDYFGSNLQRRIQYRFKFGVSHRIKEFNEQFFKHIQKVKPDLVWVFKGIDLLPDTLKRISDLGVLLANYNPDHPFIRTFRSGGGQEIEDSIPLYDLVFCYSRDLMREIETRYTNSIKLHYLPFGYEISNTTQKIVERIDLTECEERRLCFIGNPDTELRYQILSLIIKMNLPIDIYGLGWDKYFSSYHKNARVYPGVYENEYWYTLRKYRVQLNIFRPHNINSHNMRSFEIPAIGGIQLAPDSQEHREFFQSGKEIFLYNSNEDLLSESEALLRLSISDSIEHRYWAAERCRIDGYSYRARAESVFKAFKELLDEQ